MGKKKNQTYTHTNTSTIITTSAGGSFDDELPAHQKPKIEQPKRSQKASGSNR